MLSKAERKKILEEEKNKRLDAAEESMRNTLAQLEDNRNMYFKGMMEMRKRKLPSVEVKYRASLSQCLTQIAIVSETLFTLIHARQSMDFVKVQKNFVDCLSLISNDIFDNAKKTNKKKAKKDIAKIQYGTFRQEESINEVLDAVTITQLDGEGIVERQENDQAIDSMIQEYEQTGKVESLSRSKFKI